MAVLEKIRVKFGILITILVAVALLSFIIDPTTLNNARQMFSSDNKVGEMNGKTISYRDFYKEYDECSHLMEMLGQRSNDEAAQANIREMAWQNFYDEYVLIPAATDAGLAVGSEEMADLTHGENISPALTQNGMFRDENGVFQRSLVLDFIQNLDNDETGAATAYWNFLEENIYKSQLYAKYNALIASSQVSNKLETEKLIEGNNNTSDVDYVFVMADPENVEVSDSEIRALYDARKSNLKQPASRDIEYVVFEVEPSSQDIDDARSQFDELYKEFSEADNLRNFIALNSDTKWDTYYYKEAQLKSKPEVLDLINGKTGTVSAAEEADDHFAATRIVDKAQVSDSAYVWYAAVPISDEKKADSLLNVVLRTGKVTEEFNELGWLTQEQAERIGAADFAQILKAGPKAVKIKQAVSQAWFVVFATERTKPDTKYQIATLTKNIFPSEETYRDYLIKATEFADRSEGKHEKFAAVASEEHLVVVPVEGVLESTRRVGDSDNAREVVRWVFDKKTRKGSVSDVIIVDNKYYFVTAVTEVHKEGITPIEEVAPLYRAEVASKKAVTALVGEVSGKIEGCTDVEAVAAALGTTVSHQDGIAFGSPYQMSDPKLVGAVAVAETGKLCGPVEGTGGVFVFQVTDRKQGSFYTAKDADNFAAQKGHFATNMLRSILNDEAEVKDYRARFF